MVWTHQPLLLFQMGQRSKDQLRREYKVEYQSEYQAGYQPKGRARKAGQRLILSLKED